MGGKRPFVRPELKKIVWGTSTPQKVEYLHITKDFCEKALRQVIKDGGEQFEEVVSLAKKAQEPHYIIVMAKKKEEGLLAVSLLAGICNEREGRGAWEEDWDPEEELCMDEEMGWQEAWDRIPVISFADASGHFAWNGDIFSPFQNTLTMGQQNHDDFTPYWTSNRSMPICICADSADLCFAERFTDTLESFDTNRQVYLLITDGDREWGSLDAFDDSNNQNINQVILRFTAEELCIPKKSSVSKYYENVWRQMVREEGYKLERGFDVRALLRDVEKVSEEFSYGLLEQVLRYAVRSREKGILRKADFAFMERFTGKGRVSGEKERSAMQCLKEDLIGLEQVKEQVLETVQVMKFNQIRRKMGIESKGYHNVHMMLGAPGTAKTTVAQIMGRIMEEEKLLPGSQFACVNGAELKGMYVGHSAPKTKALFEENDIIVIDEAYSLSGSDGEPDSFSREAIAQLVIELEEHAMDKLVIFAGYGGSDVDEKHNKMKDFIDSNPGIKSRINSTFYFASYSPEEMAEIFSKHIQMNGYELPEGWEPVVREYFGERVQDENFGNGREARALFEKVSVQMARRVMKFREGGDEASIEKEEAVRCRLEDIQRAVERAREENRQILGRQNVRRRIGF